ncbi:MAG: hypothetical protein HEQ35_29710 [Gloeotrichia echinulata IR180]
MVNYVGDRISLPPKSGIKFPDNFIGVVSVFIASKVGIKSTNNYQCIKIASVTFGKNGAKYSNPYGGSKTINQSNESGTGATRVLGQIFP